MTPTEQIIRGGAMHPDLGARVASGRLTVEGDRLRILGKDLSVEMPLQGLDLEAGGHNDEQLFFRHSAQPQWVLTTSDHAILGELAPLAGEELQRQIRRARKLRRSSARLWVPAVLFVLILIGLVALLFAQKSKLAGMAAEKIPASMEKQFGDAVFESVRRQNRISADPRWTNQLNAVIARLLPTVTNTGYAFRFHVAEAEDLNAFAIPGGHVVVHTGLLKAVQRPEELAGVLAHEMAHVTRRHSLRNMVEMAGLSLVVQTLFGDASGLMAAAASGSELLLRQKFSRDTEREADDAGWDYLIAANVDPRGMIDFFKKMQEEIARHPAGAAMDGHLSLLATHPATAERMARLEAKWKALPRKTGFVALGTNTTEILERLR